MGCASSVDTTVTPQKPANHAEVTFETMDASGSPTARANGVKATRIATNSLAPSFTTGHRPTLASTTIGASELSTDEVGGHMRDLPELDASAAARKNSADFFASNGAGQMRALASEPSSSELQTRLAEGSTLSAVVHAAEAHTRANDMGSGTLSVVVSADQLAGSSSHSSQGKSGGLQIQTNNLPQQNEIHTRFRSTSDISQQSDDEHLAGPPEKTRDGDDHSPVVFSQQRYRASLPNYTEDPQAEQRMKEYQAKFGKKNSTMEYVEQVRRQQGLQQDFIRKKKTGTIDRVQNVVFLPRGGTYVQTAVGPIQFGIPPETIKDSMSMGLVLPSHYVLPKERFSLQTGINVAEFEFPAYFNFFVLRRKVNLICNREVEPLIRTIFQETLLGPKQIDFPTHYSEACPQESYPDLAAESKHFRRNPFDPSTELSIDTLLQFTYFENGVATLTNGTNTVRIQDRGEEYTIMDETHEVATVSSYVILTPPDLNSFFTPPKPLPGSAADRALQAAAELAESVRKENEVSMPPPAESKDGDFELDDGDHPQYHKPFVPPAFGVTMLGNSHGFDANGTTTGFVLWMNRRGIMVDPPPYSGAILKQHGIPSRLIQGIILTHCHADHDAGTFQKILEEGKVMLHTTSIIKESFLRKYSAISGLDKEFLQKLFEFREVPIGERIHVYGGSLQFFYSLHSIPCVGFSAFCNGKSMVYSADTFNDPDGIERMHQAGVMSQGRRDQLLNFPWHHSLILHEAGVPPIHTPLKTLMALPADVKERLYVVHVAGKDIPPDSGLKTAKVGPDNTLVIHNEMGQGFKALELLDLVGNIDLFQDFPLDRSVEVVQFGQWASYHQGETIIKQDTYGDKLYVIAMGVVSVSVNGKLVKYLTVGDHFGEMSIVTHQPRTATIVARSNCELIEFRGHEFMHLVRDTNAIERLRHLGLMQKVTSWQVISANSVLGKLSSTQKTYLQSILHKRTATRGEILWDQGEKAKIAVLVDEGLFVFARAKNMTPFARGAFVGDMQALLYGKPLTTTLVCAKDGTFYYITKKSLLKFFDDNPGVLIYFKDRRFVE